MVSVPFDGTSLCSVHNAARVHPLLTVAQTHSFESFPRSIVSAVQAAIDSAARVTNSTHSAWKTTKEATGQFCVQATEEKCYSTVTG